MASVSLAFVSPMLKLDTVGSLQWMKLIPDSTAELIQSKELDTSKFRTGNQWNTTSIRSKALNSYTIEYLRMGIPLPGGKVDSYLYRFEECFILEFAKHLNLTAFW